jgi:nucleoside-diphosphate-sugar epimerase
MALSAPLLDTTRAERELDWRPAWSAAETLRDMVAGIAAGAGTASPPLRPRRR